MKDVMSSRNMPVGAPQEDQVNLMELVQVLRAGWKPIAAAAVALAVISAAYVSFVAVPIYTASAVVMLDTRKPQAVDFAGMVNGLTGDSAELNTEVEVIRSRGLAQKVVEKLDLVSDPEFNTSLREPGLIGKMLGALRGAQPPSAERQLESTVSNLLTAVTVKNQPSSYVFAISVTSEDPQKAKLLADTLADTYIVNQIEMKFDATEQATEWLANRVSTLKLELEAAEEKVKAFNTQTSLVSAETLTLLEAQLKDLRERLGATERERDAAVDRLAQLEAQTDPVERLKLANDAQMSDLARRLDRGEAGVTAEDLAARYDQVVARARLDVARLKDQAAALERSRQSLSAQISSQGDDQIKLQQLTREAEASRALYEYFLSRLKESSAQQGIQQADSRVLSAAVRPQFPTAPRKKLVVVMATLLGALIGVGAVLGRHMMRSGFRSARELEDEIGGVVMGQIPLVEGADRGAILAYLRDKPASAAMEAIRNLRTSVLLSNVDKPPQVILSTSSLPGEGKTTNSLGLAMNLVGIGKSVLLIEGDIRRNTLGQYFPQFEKRPGLVSLLSGRATLETVVAHDDSIGLSLIMGERSAVNAADLFMSDAWKTLVEELRTRFDYIIIDTPPVLVVPDARIIASSADAVLFTVKWDDTSRGQVQEAVSMFETVNQPITGFVLAQIDPERMNAYGYGGKYGRYGAYASYGSKYYVE